MEFSNSRAPRDGAQIRICPASPLREFCKRPDFAANLDALSLSRGLRSLPGESRACYVDYCRAGRQLRVSPVELAFSQCTATARVEYRAIRTDCPRPISSIDNPAKVL